jgi:hypothetical protein
LEEKQFKRGSNETTSRQIIFDLRTYSELGLFTSINSSSNSLIFLVYPKLVKMLESPLKQLISYPIPPGEIPPFS